MSLQHEVTVMLRQNQLTEVFLDKSLDDQPKLDGKLIGEDSNGITIEKDGKRWKIPWHNVRGIRQ